MRIERQSVRFGPNELDFESYELRRNGVRISLSRLPLDLLILLVRRHGTLVTREEIAAHLWKAPEEVDTVGGINTAIKKVRAVLNDDAGQPRYIETVVGRGYRFIGEIEAPPTETSTEILNKELIVTEVLLPALPVEPAALANVPQSIQTVNERFSWKKRWLVGALASTLGLLVAFFGLTRHSGRVETQLLEGTQLTSNDSENRVETGAISPNGKLLAYIDRDGVFLREIGSGSTHQLRLPVSFRGERIEWFSNDLQFLLSGMNSQTKHTELWKLSIAGDPARLIKEDARNGVPSPDGMHIAFTAQNNTEIWIAGTTGEESHRFLTAAKGEQFTFIFWGDLGNRLSYQLRREVPFQREQAHNSREERYQWDYVSRSIVNSREATRVRGLRFQSACETADERLFYLHTDPWQDGARRGIWEVQIELASGSFRSKPQQLAATGDYAAYGLSTSSDGHELVTAWERGQADVYVGKFQPGLPLGEVQRLTFDTKRDFPQAWTPDGATVLFESDREGNFHLFRQRLSERTAQQLTDMHGQQVSPQITPDGQWILYKALSGQFLSNSDALYRIASEGGSAYQVHVSKSTRDFRCPMRGGSCVLREVSDNHQLVFSALDPVKGQGRELARTDGINGVLTSWAISPDGRTAALPIPHENGSLVRLVPLDASESGRRETTVSVNSPGLLLSLSWSSNGAGWFGENSQNEFSSLVYIDQKGQQSVLRETTYPTWGIPSPDGHHLAFVDYTSDRNIWLWKQR